MAVLFFLTACTHRPAPIVTPELPAEASTGSRISAAITQARSDNARQPSGAATSAVDILLKLALAGLPVPTPDDLARMAEISKLVFAGDLAAAEAKAADSARELVALRDQLKKEREASAAQIRTLLAEADARVKAAEDAGARKAFLIMITFASAVGAILSIGGALMAWMTTYKLLGGCFILLGPCVPGSALLWGKSWFFVPAGVGILLLGLALGIKLVWAILDRDGNSKLDFTEKRVHETANI